MSRSPDGDQEQSSQGTSGDSAAWLMAWAGDEASAQLEVTASGDAADAVRRHVPVLVDDHVASRLFAQDATLWGEQAESEATIRLSWVGLPRSSRPLVGEISALRAELLERGVDHVVLCGMGGSSLAPEVITACAGVPLTVLDSSDPDYVRAALGDRLDRTVAVVSSKSGSTLETDSQRRAYERAFRDAGLDPAGRMVVVTDPGSPLESSAREAGYRVVTADPHVGGRYSALTAFGLVPSGLAGVDIEGLLDEAEAVADLLSEDGGGNPALVLGAALGGTDPLRDKVVLADDGSPLPGFAGWAEQLIAESTGKNGTGLLPVVVDGPASPEMTEQAPDVLPVRLVTGADDADSVDADTADSTDEDASATDQATRATGATAPTEVTVAGSLGAQLLLWEAAVAVAGRLLGINPFDQPDVESAKKAARGLLDSPDQSPPTFVDEGIEVRGTDGLLAGVDDLPGAVAALLDRLDPHRGYLAVMAYLDRAEDAALAEVRETLARRTGRPTTFGWGPRFLHSTGQYHKGGPATGVYLQVTADPAQDLPVPGQSFTFGQLIAAQAAGDAQVLADRGRPVLRLHLTDRRRGVARLRETLA
ncbi:MAG TPA: glucose-6-phosphate isomerase [Actinomycetales bacterium]|nr:glucose-6-phosphate isomerase [Actinomycetales bacterium]